jgi:hypothetical protein
VKGLGAPGSVAVKSPTRRGILIGAALAAALAPVVEAETLASPVRIDDPPPGKALIVFFRKSEYAGGAISYIVREGQTELGRLSAGSYFVAAVDPGLHTYATHAERRDDMQIQVEAGEIYYVCFELDVGIILYQPTLMPTEEWLFDEQSPRLRLSKPLSIQATNAGAPTAP